MPTYESATLPNDISARAVALFLKASADRDTAIQFFRSFGGGRFDTEATCTATPCVMSESFGDGTADTVGYDGACLFCGTELTRKYVVTISFTVEVTAASEEDAESDALDSVDVSNHGMGISRYELTVESVEESY